MSDAECDWPGMRPPAPEACAGSVHARQFVITSADLPGRPDWTVRSLGDGYKLYHHNKLTVAPSGADDRCWAIGEVVAVNGERSWSRYQDLPAGRYVLLDWPHLRLDASGLLGVYYWRHGGHTFATSSPALAGLLTQGGRRTAWPFRPAGLNWFPPPSAPSGGVVRLLRDQRLDIRSGQAHAEARPLVPMNSEQAAREALSAELVATVTSAAGKATRVWLALTAGLDSRTILAALLASGTRFSAFTFRYPGSATQDCILAASICRYLGVPHRIVDPLPFDAGMRRRWEEHTFRSYSDADDRVLFPSGHYRFLEEGEIFMRGGCFEVGRRFYAHHLKGLDLMTATGEQIVRRFERTAAPEASAPLDRWLGWRRTHDNGLDLIDAFYLDQRVGGWLSSVEQALDVLPATSLQPANSGRILRALLTPPAAHRASGVLQRGAIRDMAPGLLRFPVNPQSFAGRARARAGALVRTLIQKW